MCLALLALEMGGRDLHCREHTKCHRLGLKCKEASLTLIRGRVGGSSVLMVPLTDSPPPLATRRLLTCLYLIHK